jgi:hypothetical protein
MRIVNINKEVFDGPNQNDLTNLECVVEFENTAFRLKFHDFSENPFERIAETIKPEELKLIIETLSLESFSFDDKMYYRAKRKLPVYYCYKNINNSNCLILVAFGEWQPARYRVIVLGGLFENIP